LGYLEVGEEFVAIFPFSFMVWNNNYKERRDQEMGMFSRAILPSSHALSEAP